MLGSGGHTTEMLSLIKNFDLKLFKPLNVVVADTDCTSIPAMESKHPLLAKIATVHRVPRSREVGQSYMSSLWTTFVACIYSIWMVGKLQPDLLICNGPGTCIPICIGALIMRFFSFLGVRDPTIVFVESFCRVESLSLSGLLLYHFVDRFVVQWPELTEKYKRAEYIGVLF